jgi:DNA-binding CsgD family transcriptional regulator
MSRNQENFGGNPRGNPKRTPKDNRDIYIYPNGVVLRAGENGVTAEHIAMLHAFDDEVINAFKRDTYHSTFYYEQVVVGESDSGCIDLPDNAYNPEWVLIDSKPELSSTERQRTQGIRAALKTLSSQQCELVEKKMKGLSNSEIARAEGVTETAIRNRLAKIGKKFESFLSPQSRKNLGGK